MNGIHASSTQKKRKKENEKGEKWKMLEYHWGLTFSLHLHMTRVMDFLTTMRHHGCTGKMNSKTCVTFTRAPHTPSEESSKQREVWVRWANEWSEQESPPWFYKIQKNLPSTAKQKPATPLINSFQRSMGKDNSASHLESKVWRESFEITLMHILSHEPETLLDPQDLFWLFLLRTSKV